MRTDDPATDKAIRPRGRGSARAFRLFLIAATVALGFTGIWVVAIWVPVLVPPWVIRRASIVSLWVILGVFVAAVPAVVVAGPWAVVAAAMARRRGDRAAMRGALRWLLLAAGAAGGLVAMEAACAVLLQWSYRIPALPLKFQDDAAADARSPTRPIDVVVVGASSARGEPYEPWVSVGQIVCWQLERVFPGREVRLDVRAQGGFCLEQAMLLLAKLSRRPEVLIVFSGQNEFQARYGWSRDVRHYTEEGPESPLALLQMGRQASSAIAMILATLDRHYGSTPAPERVTRELVDHPVCLPKEYDFLREDFGRRIDALAEYGRRVGALPVLIVPGSNDGAFEPSRSVLSGATPLAEREAFAQAFRAARAMEASDPPAAAAAYRRLLERHPEFAEAHYRLGRLLLAVGDAEAARDHFIRARDLDGLPLRCPSDFRDAIRAVAARRDVPIVDVNEILSRISPTGILDDRLFHDAHHPALPGTVAIARGVLEQLRRRALGWPESTPAPDFGVEETARYFGLNANRWSNVCSRSADFFRRTAFVRYDPATRLEVATQYMRASNELAAGRPPRPPFPPSLDLPLAPLRPSESLAQPAESAQVIGPGRSITIERNRVPEPEGSRSQDVVD